MVFFLFVTLTTVSLITLPKDMAAQAKQGAWVTILLTALLFGVMAAIIVKLSKMHNGKVLFDYSRELTGRFMSYTFAVFYVLYFLVVNAYLSAYFVTILRYDFLPKTPQWATLLLGIPLFGFIAFKGITNTARLLEIFGLLLLIASVVICISMYFEGDVKHLLPVFTPSRIGDYISSIKNALFAFLGIEILTVIPMSKENKKAPRVAFFTLIGIGLFYILIVGGCYAIVGINEITHYNDSLITAIRLVHYPQIEFLQRLDIVYMTVGFMVFFASQAIVYLAAVEYLCRIFSKAKRIVIVISAGVAVYLLSMLFAGIGGTDSILHAVITFTGLIAAFIIPLLLFLIAQVKKHVAKSR